MHRDSLWKCRLRAVDQYALKAASLGAMIEVSRQLADNADLTGVRRGDMETLTRALVAESISDEIDCHDDSCTMCRNTLDSGRGCGVVWYHVCAPAARLSRISQELGVSSAWRAQLTS
eukprot:TRINITY_DN998_c0_g1_i18.p1 TRINITY_DN998_c0_g1~~TRINITY_DN998_c0_g1_i18.p1  ORF type:complete len:118 (-),score=12.81 TRINITY_DN998_c0_g1_i18:312-665(-)